MVQNDKRKDETPGPTDPFAAATAVGFAMASQALEMWFGVVSGVARASQDMLDRHARDKAEPAAYAPEPKSTATVAQAAARTVVAEVERMTKSVSEVATKAAERKAPDASAKKPSKPVAKKAEQAKSPASNVVPIKPNMPGTQTRADEQKAEILADAAEAPSQALPLATETATQPDATVAAIAVAPVAPEVTPAAEMKAAKTVKGKAPVDLAATDDAAKSSKAAAGTSRLMPEDFRAPAKVEKPANPDDLKQLAGVGPKLEAVLNGLGVWTFAQIAAWTPEEVAYVEDMTGLNGRIASDKWLELAADLSRGSKAQS